MNNGYYTTRQTDVRKIDLRRVAEFHATGSGLGKGSAESQRLTRLAINEAEALAAQTGVPELVLPGLAEEKVQKVRTWEARQHIVWTRRNELRPGLN